MEGKGRVEDDLGLGASPERGPAEVWRKMRALTWLLFLGGFDFDCVYLCDVFPFLLLFTFSGDGEEVKHFRLKLKVLFSSPVQLISIVRIWLVYFNIFKTSHKPNRTSENELCFLQK